MKASGQVAQKAQKLEMKLEMTTEPRMETLKE
jgi:hypothetical protein